MRPSQLAFAAVVALEGVVALLGGAGGCSGSNFTTARSDASVDGEAEGADASGVDASLADSGEIADGGNVLLSESFENTTGMGCGEGWNPVNSMLTVVSPGHGDGQACLVCLLGAPSAYGLSSKTPNLEAGAGQVLTASAYIMAATPDGGSVTDAGAQVLFLGIDWQNDDGGFLSFSGPTVPLLTSWTQALHNQPVTENLHAIALRPQISMSSALAGSCFVIDDILLVRQ